MMSACRRYFTSTPEPGLPRWQWYPVDCPSVAFAFVIIRHRPLPGVWCAKVSEGRACAFRLHVDPGAGLPRGVVSLAADATATERLRLDVVREDANPRDPADGPAPLAVDELMTSAAARSVDPGDGDEDSDGDSGDARGGRAGAGADGAVLRVDAGSARGARSRVGGERG